MIAGTFLTLLLFTFVQGEVSPENESTAKLMERMKNVTTSDINGALDSSCPSNSTARIASIKLDFIYNLADLFTTAPLRKQNQANFTDAIVCALTKVTLIPKDRIFTVTNATCVSIVFSDPKSAQTTLYIIIGVICGVVAIVVLVGVNEVRKNKLRRLEERRKTEDETKPMVVSSSDSIIQRYAI